MMRFAILGMLCVTSAATADDATKNVPYRRTDTQHILVRAKINGKGPFNFILDTGAPVMFVSTPVGKKIGLDSKNGWATLDRLDIEGGISLSKVKCRVETPFQLEGMNGMGLAGAELHGILGYTLLAKFRMEIDFTRDKMRWTPLDFAPPPPAGLGGKAGGQAGLEMLGTFMKLLGFLAGTSKEPPLPRGFVGLQLAEKDERVTVVAAVGPAQKAGLAADDRLLEVNGQPVQSIAAVHERLAAVTRGQPVRLLVQRGEDRKEFRLSAGDGL